MTRLRDKKAQLERLKKIADSKDGILLSTEFKTAKTKYRFKCKEGHEFELTSDKIVSRGDWCPYCAGRYGDFHEKFRHIIEDINGGKMLSKYKNYGTPIKYACSNGHINYADPRNLHAGKWCKQCQSSHGEKAIERYLKQRGIEYKKQYIFPDLKGKQKPLPFDFAVFEDGVLNCLIEYDGEQHFRPMRHSKNKERNLKKFKETQRNDQLKNQYCEDNNIKLIRISCFDVDYRRINNLYQDIKDILDVELELDYSC